MNHFLILVAALSLGTASYGADKPAAKTAAMNPTAEQRTKMADAHEKMAACLRSDSPFHDCMTEMMKTCRSTMGKNGCPMGHMGMMHGKMGAHMMMEENEKEE